MKYYVYEERYLCYPIREVEVFGKQFMSAVVMRADVMKGGDPNLIDREILMDTRKLREASKSDFEKYKVRIDT